MKSVAKELRWMFLLTGLIGFGALANAAYSVALQPVDAPAWAGVDLNTLFFNTAAAVVCLIAWRKLGSGGKAARAWALAASAMLVLIGVIPPSTLYFSATGVAGLIVFGFWRNSIPAPKTKTAGDSDDQATYRVDWTASEEAWDAVYGPGDKICLPAGNLSNDCR